MKVWAPRALGCVVLAQDASSQPHRPGQVAGRPLSLAVHISEGQPEGHCDDRVPGLQLLRSRVALLTRPGNSDAGHDSARMVQLQTPAGMWGSDVWEELKACMSASREVSTFMATIPLSPPSTSKMATLLSSVPMPVTPASTGSQRPPHLVTAHYSETWCVQAVWGECVVSPFWTSHVSRS